jgi:hypothetical protein
MEHGFGLFAIFGTARFSNNNIARAIIEIFRLHRNKVFDSFELLCFIAKIW